MTDTLISIARSWCETENGLHTTEEILDWVRQRNETISVEIRKCRLEDCDNWFYDAEEGCIRNGNRSFFSVTGFECSIPDGSIITQPILLQQEIGYLGIICREFSGVMHFLMQAKIEPGNVNKIQLSPTIQATKSNFTQKHGGKQPAYLQYFLDAERYEIVMDQIQSEQSSRFYHKRNRNTLIRVEEEIEVLPSHMWMTLGQIKRLMRVENLVNMDTRTVISCIPFSKVNHATAKAEGLDALFRDMELYRSVFAGEGENQFPQVFRYINDRKMFDESDRRFLNLRDLTDWEMKDGEFVCRQEYPFKVVFCDISIEGREVRHWTQPLFEAVGIAVFGLICCQENGVLKFLVHAAEEVGCFDVLELGPTVQREASAYHWHEDEVNRFFFRKLEQGEGIFFDHLLSEEGGRFYHEQNRNILMRVDRAELPELPAGYFLLDHRTLNQLVQVNNVLNIQLRNLLSLLEA